MDITALLSQRVASVSSVPAGDSAGGFANVLQSVAARSAAGQAAPLGQQAASMPPALADTGSSGSRLPLQFTIAELQSLPPALATETDAGEPITGDTAASDDELIAMVAELAPEAAPLADPGTISQAATASGAEPVQQGLPTMDGRQSAVEPVSFAEATTRPAPLSSAATVAAATAAPTPTALAGDRAQAPAALAANGALAETRPDPANFATATTTLTPNPTQAMDASLATTAAATGAGTAPGAGLPLPEVDWSRNGAAEQQRGPVEPAANAALTSSALAGTGSSTPQPAMSALLQASLSAPVASPVWQQQLGSQLTGLAQRGQQQIELHLNPADLGPLSVSLKVDDHGAQAQFLSAHATVRAAVEQAIPQLREALAEQGISLGETSVGEQQHHGNEQSGSGQGPVSTTAAVGSGDAADGAVDAAAATLSGVDIYA